MDERIRGVSLGWRQIMIGGIKDLEGVTWKEVVGAEGEGLRGSRVGAW